MRLLLRRLLLPRLLTRALPSKQTAVSGLMALEIDPKPRICVAFFLCVTLLCWSDAPVAKSFANTVHPCNLECLASTP
jgi:hypothetical protein